MGSFEVGSLVRAPRQDWVRVTFAREIRSGTLAGEASIGYGSDLFIRLRYDVERDLRGLNNSRKCESATVLAADHEIVHTMGFYHTDTTWDDFASGDGCPGAGRPDRVRFHAGVMYSRPRGNADPDFDPPGYFGPATAALRSSTRHIVQCAASLIR